VIERLLFGWAQFKQEYKPGYIEGEGKCYVEIKPVFIDESNGELVDETNRPFIWLHEDASLSDYMGLIVAPAGIVGLFKSCPMCEDEYFIGLKIPNVRMTNELSKSLIQTCCPDCIATSLNKIIPEEETGKEGDEDGFEDENDEDEEA